MTYTHLTIDELTVIYNFWKSGTKDYTITNAVGRSKETIYKMYRWFDNDGSITDYLTLYRLNKSHCGRKRITLPNDEIDYIKDKVNDGWQPDTIIGRAERSFSCCVRTLYRMFKRGDFGFSAENLLMESKHHPNGYVERRGKSGQLGISINQREKDYPNYVQEFGHLEGDTVQWKNHLGAVTTLSERLAKVEIILNSHDKSAESVGKVLEQGFSSIPRHLSKSITFDNGKEFADWRNLANKFDINIYFAEVGAPNQRGLNENNNGLARRDGLSKDLDFRNLSDWFLQSVASRRNHIPRKSLDYLTPLEAFLKHVTDEQMKLFLA